MVLVSSQKPLKDQFASFSTKRCIMGVVPVAHLNMKALNILIMNMLIKGNKLTLKLLICGEFRSLVMKLPETEAFGRVLCQFVSAPFCHIL